MLDLCIGVIAGRLNKGNQNDKDMHTYQYLPPCWGLIDRITNWLQPGPKPFVNAGPFCEWASTITQIAKPFVSRCLPKKGACSSQEDLTKLTHVINFEERHSLRKEGACGSPEDLIKLNSCQKTRERHFH